MRAADLRRDLAIRVNSRVFYGWVMLGVGITGTFASGPANPYVFSVFIEPMSAELGLSRTSMSSAFAFATIVQVFWLAYVGRVIDRFGVAVVLGALGFALGIGAMSFSVVAGPLTLFLVLTAMRLVGHGALELCSVNLVSQWFYRKRGFALSLCASGYSLGYAVFPPFTLWLIEQVGWRQSWVWLGLCCWGLLIVPALLLVHSRPERLGLHPDGVAPPADEPKPPPAAPPESSDDETLAGALHTRAFWIFAVVMASFSVVATSMIFHQVPFLQAQGLSAARAAGNFSITALVMVCTFPLMGWLLDRFSARVMLFIGALLQLAAIGALLLSQTSAMAALYGALLGLASTSTMASGFYVWPTYFGRRHLSAIHGSARTIGIFGAALGPLLVDLAAGWFGGYAEAFLLLCVLPVGVAVLVWLAPPARRVLQSAAVSSSSTRGGSPPMTTR